MGTSEAPALAKKGKADSLQSGACVGSATQDVSPHVLQSCDAHGDRHACVGFATQDASPHVLRFY